MTAGSRFTALLAGVAILAFAGNSLLARAALADGAIEAGAFSVIRLAAGALVLLPLIGARPSAKDVPGALSLAIYIAGFSFAYLNLGAGMGALILFACVQATIIIFGASRGEGPSRLGWSGLVLAFGGLIVLLAPADEQSVKASSAIMMGVAGMAWGAYTLIGRSAGASAGIGDAKGGAAGRTARSFLLAAPLVLPMLWLDSGPSAETTSAYGAMLAVIAGAITSGLGYVIWYKVTPMLGLATVASVQLATPVVAAIGGAVVLSEPLGWRLLAGGAMILGGIVMTIVKPRIAI